MRIFGIVPARMAASRFPGKPLYPILGKPLVEHCFRRAAKYRGWSGLWLATCDQEILDFALKADIPCVMTASTHVRALERVAEGAQKSVPDLADSDIVVCVQGDEPLLTPQMIEAVIDPLVQDASVRGTILAMHIVDEEQWRNPDIVKLIHNVRGDVLYTSRSPVPYAKKFSPEMNALRIHGIFGFRWEFLKLFCSLPESPLEKVESCDSNRFLDNGYHQKVVAFPNHPSFSVDSPEDIHLVEAAMRGDPLFGTY